MREIVLKSGDTVIVDDSDYELVSKYTWCIDKSNGYVRTNTGEKMLSIHRVIMNPPKDKHVDHINRNKLDNRRCNLRLATFQQNVANSIPRATQEGRCGSKYKGVCKVANSHGYRAQIKHQGVFYHLGISDCEADAAMAYDIFALKFNGDYAYLNFHELKSKYIDGTICPKLFKQFNETRGCEYCGKSFQKFCRRNRFCSPQCKIFYFSRRRYIVKNENTTEKVSDGGLVSVGNT